MLYVLMFITALFLSNVLHWNLFAAALVSAVGWGIVGGIGKVFVGNGK